MGRQHFRSAFKKRVNIWFGEVRSFEGAYDQLITEVRAINEIDKFVVFSFKFSRIATFIHQKYYSGDKPGNYRGVEFKSKTSCLDLNFLPYEDLMGDPKTRRFQRALGKYLAGGIEASGMLKECGYINHLLNGARTYALYPEFDIAGKRDLLRVIHLGIHV